MTISINWIAVVLAAVAAFALGSIWYGPLFSKAWLRENGFTAEGVSGRRMAPLFIGSFGLTAFAAAFLAAFVGPDATAGFGAIAGGAAGIGWVATFTGIHYLYEGKSLKLFLINAGYSVSSLIVMGAIIGAM